MTTPDASGCSAQQRGAVQAPPVPTSTRSVAGIADALLEALRELDTDVTSGSFTITSISVLRRDLHAAVRSLLGFTLTLTVPGPALSVAISVCDEPFSTDQAADCLVLRLPPQDNASTASLTVYAADESGLAALRENLASTLDRPESTLAASPDAPTKVVMPGITGLEEFLAVYRSMGVLLATGYSEQDALTELVRRAHSRPAGLTVAAQTILEQV